MARPNKVGLDYFPFNVDLFDDDKMQLISSEFGSKGEVIYIRLLCKIYKNGYYYQWGKDEALLFARGVGNGVTGALVDEVVNGCIKRLLFDEQVFNMFRILTSKGIQERYQYICKQLKRPFEIDERYDCRNLTMLKRQLSTKKKELSPVETHQDLGDNAQKKGKEIKGKESELIPPPETFIEKLFSAPGELDRQNINLQIRPHEVTHEKAVQFNAHLFTSRKMHETYEKWLLHFTAWVRINSVKNIANTQPQGPISPKKKIHLN